MFAIAAAVFSISCIQLAISQCPQNCQACSNTNQCLSCKVGYWGADFGCANTCSNNCTHSNCDNKGYCYSCVDAMYGTSCSQECRLCMNEECGLRECTLGCKDGYFQSINEDYSYCYPCQDNCQRCQNFTYCTLCKAGYYIFRYTNTNIEPKRGVAACISCQSNNLCDQCSQLPNCSQCSYSNFTLACEHCAEGYTLDNNQCVKTKPCPKNCLNGCTLSGECNECIDGRTGLTCDYLCAYECGKCPQYNQNLCQACKDGFYTSTCAINCPSNCANGQCDFYNGSCLNGCLSGFWGDKCELYCSDHCTLLECNRDGTCSHGCAAAYDGLYCNITTPTTKTTLLTPVLTSGLVPFNTRSVSSMTTTTPSSETGSANTRSESCTGLFTVIFSQEEKSSFGPVIGGAVITALLVGSIAYFLYRRTVSRTSNREQQMDTMYYNTVGRSSVNEETGQNINKASKLETTQTPEISVYDQLSRTNIEHVYTGL